MRIAIIRKKYTFHGGAEGFSQALIKRLAEAGNEVHIFAIRWDASVRLNNVHFHKVPAITFNSAFRDLSFAFSTYRLLKKERFDIIQSHDKTLYQDIYRAGDGCHIEWLKQRWKRSGPLKRFLILCNPYHWMVLSLERLILRRHRFKKVIAISELVKKEIIDNYGVEESDIEVVYNGVDLERFHPRNRDLYRHEIRSLYQIPDNEFVILFIGSGFERKGVKFLLRAVNSVPHPVTVLIVGRGSPKKFGHLMQNQRVIFCGPRSEIEKYYAAADIFVFPSFYEPFGNVHLEALASGLPVITTGLSGAAEIIRDGIHGFVVPLPEDYQLIADKMQLLMAEVELRGHMGINARQLAEEFSFEEHSKKVGELYGAIMARRDVAGSRTLSHS